MTRSAICLIAAVIVLCLSGAQWAQTAPLRCSAEEKTCIATCNKNSNRTLIPNCIANCRTRMSVCRQTGCWSNGVNRYCGLTRQ
jgi:hypothetical protein